MLSINTNLSSMIVQNSMGQATSKLNQAIERMSTGFKINHASDNAANYSISTNMTTKLNAYEVAADNVTMGMDLVTTADDTISLMQNKAERLRSLCIQARNGTYGTQSLNAINSEANSILAEINRIYSTAQYNGISLFTGGTTENVATASETPEVATFAMRRSAEPEMATFAMTRATTVDFIKDPVTYKNQSYVDNLTAVSEVVDAEGFTETEYKIAEVEDLVKLAELTNSGVETSGITFILAKDIDLGDYCEQEIANGNYGWTPIGVEYNTFRGDFDGNGHVISNLKIDAHYEVIPGLIEGEFYQGLFGVAEEGELRNVGLVNVNIRAGEDTGGLAGDAYNVTNCYVTGSVAGYEVAGCIGGLVGYATGTITDSYSTCTVTGHMNVGGLVGNVCESSIINNSYATGNVTGDNSVGGLVGYSSSSISNSYSACTVTGNRTVGGLVGDSQGSITNSYATGNVSAEDGTQIGGLAGNANNITNSYATGNVTSNGFSVGGLAGMANNVSNCYATGNVSGDEAIGGLVGRDSNIVDSYATGAVSGTTDVGGLVGTFPGTISNCAATQTDSNATLMTEEQIKSTYTPETMGYTEANGWTIVNGVPLQSWQEEAQDIDPDPTPTPTPTPTPDGGSSSGDSYGVDSFVLQVGVNGDCSSQIAFDINFTYYLSEVGADITSDFALSQITDFINLLSEKQTQFGAIQNRLESALDSISVSIENLTSSLSTIRDADIAELSSQYIKMQILQQASATLLATANQSPSIALQLI